MIENADIDYDEGTRQLDLAIWHEVSGAPDCIDGSTAPRYTLYVSEAMLVLDLFPIVMIERSMGVEGVEWTVSIGDRGKTWSDPKYVSTATHRLLPVAICRAALKKVRGLR